MENFLLIASFKRFLPIQLENLMLIPPHSAIFHITANLNGYFPVRSISHGSEVKFAGGFPLVRANVAGAATFLHLNRDLLPELKG
jgi:hypothetical protein